MDQEGANRKMKEFVWQTGELPSLRSVNKTRHEKSWGNALPAAHHGLLHYVTQDSQPPPRYPVSDSDGPWLFPGTKNAKQGSCCSDEMGSDATPFRSSHRSP